MSAKSYAKTLAARAGNALGRFVAATLGIRAFMWINPEFRPFPKGAGGDVRLADATVGDITFAMTWALFIAGCAAALVIWMFSDPLSRRDEGGGDK